MHTHAHTNTYAATTGPPPASQHAVTRPLHQKDDICFSALPFILRRALRGRAPNAATTAYLTLYS